MFSTQATHAQTLPSATVRVWNITTPIGFTPDPSREDVLGVTKHVATTTDPRTVVTAIDNTTHPGGPCGVIFWNPMTSFFKWYGIGFGFQIGVDINVKAPLKTAGTGRTFGPGDVWLAKTGCPGLYMNFAGSDNFRSFGITTKGVHVDQTTGNVWFTEILAGNLTVLDPTTSGATRWNVGGSPHFVTLDSVGRAYATVGCLNQIVRVDPATNEVSRWAIPSAGLRCGLAFAETSDGIVLDSASRVWFAESASSKIGRLDPSTNEVCEFTKPGLSNPELVASSGSGSILQVFFTEGAGNAGSVLTQAVAAGTCVTVSPAVQTLTPTLGTLAFTDFTEKDGATGCPCSSCRSPLTATITPTTHIIPGVDGGGSGTITTIDGLPVPGILRFPFPSASPPVPITFPSGMTGVVFPNTIYGSDLNPSFTPNNHVFELKSSVIIAPPPPSVQKCPLTLGFWKNHSQAWPVSSLVLGSQTYTQAELLTILGTPSTRDASLILARQLIAAKLNIFNGSDSTPIFATINAADSLLGGFSGKLPYIVDPSSTTGQAMVNDANVFDSYNSGQLTPNCNP